MIHMNDRLLTEYTAGRMRQGFDYLAMYLAATLFERIVCQKLEKAAPATYQKLISSKDKNTLYDIIDALKRHDNSRYRSPEYLFKHIDNFPVSSWNNAIKRLNHYRIARNKIVHSKNPERLIEDSDFKKVLVEMLLYSISENCPELYQKHFAAIDEFTREKFREVLDAKVADYLVRSVDEVMIKRFDQKIGTVDDQWQIELADFDNLFTLRNKLASFKNSTDQWLKENYRSLKTTTLTTIDTSSAYIWLPIVHKENAPATDRPNLATASASILVTPLDFRIYIDFGGLCYDDRKQYFSFIKDGNGAFRTFLNDLDSEARGCFRIFDVSWYSFITQKRTPESILQNWSRWEAQVNRGVKELEKLRAHPIITTNNLLSGYILDRKWIKKNGPLTEDLIHEKLGQVIDLYYNLLLSKTYSKEG